MHTTLPNHAARCRLRTCCICFFVPLLLAVAVYPVLWHLAKSSDVTANPTICKVVAMARQKSHDAASVQGRKVLFLGGSATHYGLRADEFTRRTGLASYNMGLNAGLGAGFLLELAKPTLHSGDVVVLIPELPLYAAQTANVVFSKVSFCLGSDFAWSMPWDQRLTHLRNIGPAHLLEGAWRRLAGQGGETGPCRQVSDVTASGDIAAYFGDSLIAESFAATLAEEKAGLTHFFQADEDPGRQPPAAAIAAFKLWCDQRQITVLATYPNIFLDAEFADSAGFRTFVSRIERMYRDLGIIFVGGIDDALYPKELFLDTHYHLGLRGARKHTDDFASLFCRTSGLCP